MKQKVVLLMGTLLLLSACSAPHAPAAQSPAPQMTESSSRTATPTADGIGGTAENYPKIDGSTSTLPIVKALYQTVFGTESIGSKGYPEVASKTVPSYEKLLEGQVDMIIVPNASAEIVEKAKKAGVELEFHKIAAEALVFITPAENTAENITAEQVRSIYLDYGIRDWSELGGPKRTLVPICRNADSGSQSQLDNLILEGQNIHPDIQKNFVELTMDGMLEQTAFYHNGGLSGSPTESYALGYTLFQYLQQMDGTTGIGDYLKMLSYEGSSPTVESIIDGTYPLSIGYYAVVRGDMPADHTARAIVSWLESSEGQNLVRRNGFIPAVQVQP